MAKRRKTSLAADLRPFHLRAAEDAVKEIITDDDTSYLVLGASALLTHERILTIGNGLQAADGGSGGAYTISVKLGSGLTLSGTSIVLAFSGNPGTISPDDAANAGASAYAARTDHTHAITCAIAGSISPDDSAAEGVAVSFARSDHRHAISCEAPTTDLGISSTNAEGDRSAFARSNHSHAITTSSNPGAAAVILASNASGYLQLVRLGLGVAPGYALHISSTSEQARIAYDASNYASLTVSSKGALTIDTTTGGSGGNLVLTPAGNLITDPDGLSILPAAGYEVNIGAINNKYLTLHAAELWVETLVAQNTIATIGGRILVGPTTTLTRNLAAGDTGIYVKHNQMAVGDTAYLEANGQVEFIYISGSPVQQAEGDYRHTVTRNRDGSGANDWYAGDAVFNTGATNDGWIDLYSLHGVAGMRLDYIYNYDATGIGGGGVLATFSSNYADDTNWQMFADSANNGINDCVYFGKAGSQYSQINFYVAIAANYNATLVWEYWNGSAWTAFTPTLDSDLKTTGGKTIAWDTLAGWASTTVNGAAAYWIRRRISAFTSWTTLPTVYIVRTNLTSNWGPTIVGNVRTSSTFNMWSEHWALGNLIGLYDYGANTYGFAAGKYSSTTTWLSADATNGIRMMRGDTCLGQWATNGAIIIGQTGASQSNVYITSGAVQLRTDTTVNLELTTAGKIILGDDAGGVYVTIDSTGIEMYSNAIKVVDIDGATGDFIFGEVATNKSNLFWDESEGKLSFRGGLNGTVVQAYVDSDGAIYAGGGTVKLDANGIKITASDAYHDNNALLFIYDSNHIPLTIDGRYDGVTEQAFIECSRLEPQNDTHLYVRARSGAGGNAQMDLTCQYATGWTGIYIDATSSARLIRTSKDKFLIADTANAKSTQGLTINQGAYDDEILSLKSSDVAHGVTDWTETDTYGVMMKYSATAGGLHIVGLCDTGTVGLSHHGLSVAADTTKATTSIGTQAFNHSLKSGTGVSAIGANGNLVVFRNNGTTRFILDGDGDSHQDVGTAWTNFDEYDDIALLTLASAHLTRPDDPLKASFGAWLEQNRQPLQDAKLVTFNSNGHHFVNWSRMHMLEIGAVRQLADRIFRLEKVLSVAGINPSLIQ